MQNDAKQDIFNVTKFTRNFEGMEDLAVSAAEEFMRGLPRQFAILEGAVQKKDFKAIELSAHSLKGSVSSFFAERCRNVAFQIEKKGRERTDDGIERLLSDLKSELSLFEHELAQWKRIAGAA